MSLRVAVQMDPLEGINLAGDSTFALMLSAQERGHSLYHYRPEDLSWADGRLWAGAFPVTVRRRRGKPFPLRRLQYSRPRPRRRRGADAPGPAVRPRLHHRDPPARADPAETLVVNDPASVRNAPEKIWVLDFARFMPPTMSSPARCRATASSSPSMARSSSSRSTAMPARRCSRSGATAPTSPR
jgi:glutathione synthase